MNKLIILAVFIVIFNSSAHSSQTVEVIDTPTAHAIDFETYDLSFRLYDQGSILTRLFYGMIIKNLTLGLSFDAEGVVGTGDVDIRRPYLYVKIPVYGGSRKWPAISVGFDEQGTGKYNEEEEAYQYPPTGFFLVMTQKYLAPGLDVSAGVSADYSSDGDKSEEVTGFVNSTFMLGPDFMLMAEGKAIGGDAYVNAGFRYNLEDFLSFDFGVTGIMNEDKEERILRVIYRGAF